jgi:peptidoglycan/LPS O-acetylase OafA/YrhL
MILPLADIPADIGPLVPLAWTAPAAVIVIGVLIMYWRRLRPRDIPRSRRRIRRANTLVQFTLTLMLVYALSIADGDRRPAQFTVAWIGVVGLVLITIAFAVIDSFNTMRLHHRIQTNLRREAMQDLGRAIKSQSQTASESDTASAGEND